MEVARRVVDNRILQEGIMVLAQMVEYLPSLSFDAINYYRSNLFHLVAGKIALIRLFGPK